MTKPSNLTGLLETLCPMFVLLDAHGEVRQVGPTLQKLRPYNSMAGQQFLNVFELIRPRTITNLSELMSSAGGKLHLKFSR